MWCRSLHCPASWSCSASHLTLLCCHNPIQTDSRHLGENDNKLIQRSKDIDSTDGLNDVKSVFFLLNHLVEQNIWQTEWRVIGVHFCGQCVHCNTRGQCWSTKNQSESQIGPRQCLAFLFIFELGNMACGCTASAPQWPNSVSLTHPVFRLCSCSPTYSPSAYLSLPSIFSQSIQIPYIRSITVIL